jgi:hypothetical protein
MSVSVPVTSGGCGTTHSRPVRNGAPAANWELTCPPCERFLKGGGRRILKFTPGDLKNGILPGQERVADSDPCWAPTPDTVPMTPDEAKSDGRFRETAQLQISMMNALGTAMANGLQIPSEMMYLLKKNLPEGVLPATLQGTMVCSIGHDNPAGVKFCHECGISMDTKVSGPVEPLELPLEMLHVQTLRKKCREAGQPANGTKEQLIGRLQHVKV